MMNRNEQHPIPDEKWQAIISNDATYDGTFFYAVKTTGIFCRPSCKSRIPKKDNVRVFENAEQALSEHFRPCKRCKPTGQRLPDQEWVDQIVQCMELNYSDTLTLETLADMCHGSPFHLQRVFKRVKGITPVEYIQQIRVAKAKQYLEGSDKAISEIAISVGIPNTSYFITLFKAKTGCTPADYRKINRMGQTTEVSEREITN
ncbi:bifunctional transcriptional activator/DNA repair enzyme AdaA [Paenibacillus agilis]|uniref:Methylphosphotriester-DNA--protein-cysteine methyltransferase family protein n=1 Tax=Paenibacillus agilis TaxID=3020863 RepID=A0A559IQ27_9BACL|nr:bifunctional transcriptional activator/DNA repair enzyme AdaA [Paenibacillus agilis]TVX89741.1 methylphosphotriester-DNA--protein-cysteine methyltransferase family protein [Paenibacillus agilis]